MSGFKGKGGVQTRSCRLQYEPLLSMTDGDCAVEHAEMLQLSPVKRLPSPSVSENFQSSLNLIPPGLALPVSCREGEGGHAAWVVKRGTTQVASGWEESANACECEKGGCG